MPNWTHQIPGSLIKAFLNIAKETKCPKGLVHVECLGLLVGIEKEGILTATDLIFPGQHGTQSVVIDDGKIFLEVHLTIAVKEKGPDSVP